MPRWYWKVKQLASKLWFRASIFCVAGILTALVALVLKDFIPAHISRQVGADAVDAILQILASSMLAVTTFSLSTVVAAYSSASSNATPRATKLLLEDSTAQNALSTFIGAFLFSLVGIIALHMGIYGDSGRLVLFIVTLGVIFIIVAMLLQWIEHLTQLGRIGHTVAMVERATQKAFDREIEKPCMGGTPLQEYVPFPTHHPIFHPDIGYIQHIDMHSLSELAERLGTPLFIQGMPGHFNDCVTPLLYSGTALEEEEYERIRDAFSIDIARSFDQDPRYGLVVLGEIASRALSPAVNDPGTAIGVIGTAVRILASWVKPQTLQPEIRFDKIFVPTLRIHDMLNDILTPIARDGAAMLEVDIRLQKAYNALIMMTDKEYTDAITRHRAIFLKRAQAALSLEEDRQRLAEARQII